MPINEDNVPIDEDNVPNDGDNDPNVGLVDSSSKARTPEPRNRETAKTVRLRNAPRPARERNSSRSLPYSLYGRQTRRALS